MHFDQCAIHCFLGRVKNKEEKNRKKEEKAAKKEDKRCKQEAKKAKAQQKRKDQGTSKWSVKSSAKNGSKRRHVGNSEEGLQRQEISHNECAAWHNRGNNNRLRNDIKLQKQG